MELHPIQAFKNLSTGKKVAVTAGSAAAIGVTALAYTKGKKICLQTDKFTTKGEGDNAKKTVKLFDALKEGFKKIGSDIKAKLPFKKAGAEAASEKAGAEAATDKVNPAAKEAAEAAAQPNVDVGQR